MRHDVSQSEPLKVANRPPCSKINIRLTEKNVTWHKKLDNSGK